MITSENNANTHTIRISKYLAQVKQCSRRDAENLVSSGKVTINKNIIRDLSYRIDPIKDKMQLVGHVLHKPDNKTRVWLYNKPVGLITSHSDEKGRKTVFDVLPKNLPRGLKSVGRLDYNTGGLLILTNDGDFSHYLEHPKNSVLRIYNTKIFGYFDKYKIDKLAQGITLGKIKYSPVHIKIIKQSGPNALLEIKITEGKNREIRKILKNYLGVMIKTLTRVRYGRYKLSGIALGCIKELPHTHIAQDMKTMHKQLSLST